MCVLLYEKLFRAGFFYSDYSRVEDNLMFEHYNLESSGGGVFDLLLLENS